MFDKMQQIYEMQKKAKELQKQLQNERVDISSADGKVRVMANGSMRIEQITIDPALLTADQKIQLERTLMAVLNDALAQVQQAGAAQAASLMKGLGL